MEQCNTRNSKRKVRGRQATSRLSSKLCIRGIIPQSSNKMEVCILFWLLREVEPGKYRRTQRRGYRITRQGKTWKHHLTRHTQHNVEQWHHAPAPPLLLLFVYYTPTVLNMLLTEPNGNTTTSAENKTQKVYSRHACPRLGKQLRNDIQSEPEAREAPRHRFTTVRYFRFFHSRPKPPPSCTIGSRMYIRFHETSPD